MPRTHISNTAERIVLREVAQDPTGRLGGAYKPGGFWYQVDGDWERWCREEEWGIGDLGFVHGVELGAANILLVDSVAKLDAFHRRYFMVRDRYLEGIDWPRVAADYDGLEIAPYQWERRLAPEFTWYYGWDCASGVIWRPRDAAVTLLGPVLELAPSQPEEGKP